MQKDRSFGIYPWAGEFSDGSVINPSPEQRQAADERRGRVNAFAAWHTVEACGAGARHRMINEDGYIVDSVTGRTSKQEIEDSLAELSLDQLREDFNEVLNTHPDARYFHEAIVAYYERHPMPGEY